MSDFYLDIQDRNFEDYTPDPSLKFVVDSAEFSAMGGPKKANVRVTGTNRAVWALLDWLRYGVVIRTEKAERFWWGYVNSVAISQGGSKIVMSLDEVFNAVKVSFMNSPTGAEEVGDRLETDWALDNDSLGEYGRKETIAFLDAATLESAEARRDAILAAQKNPHGEFEPGLLPGSNPDIPVSAEIRLSGWWQTLDWRYASTPPVEGITYWPSTIQIALYAVGHPTWQKAMQTFTTDAEGGVVREISLQISRMGSPLDNLTAGIYELDGSGHPTGSALGSVSISGTDLEAYQSSGVSHIKTRQFSAGVTLDPSTEYGLVLSRSGSLDGDNYYLLRVDKALGYADGEFWYYPDTGAWVRPTDIGVTDVDLPFILWMEEFVGAGRQMAGMVDTYGDLISETVFEDTSTVEQSSYLSGTRTTLTELVAALESGGANNRQMLAWVDWERILRIYEEPASTTIAYAMDREGRIMNRARQAVGLGELSRVPGNYVQVIDMVPDGVNLSKLVDPTLQYVEAIRWTRSRGIQPVLRDQPQLESILSGRTGGQTSGGSGASAAPGYTPGSYADENAQDAVGRILTDTASIDFTWNNEGPNISADVLPAGVNHDNLLNYSANKHIDHTAVSVLAGAGLTGGGAINANRTLAVGAGAGITVNADTVALTTPGTLDVASINDPAGNHKHAITSSSNPGAAAALLATDGDGLLQLAQLALSSGLSSHLAPLLTDTYDLGSSTKLWRKGYLSELDAVLFAQNTVTLIGGWLFITKNEGSFPSDVVSVITSIDFGTTMTPGDFVLCRAAGKVEYIEIGSLVSGTTYNVTRDKDGSGANDWPAGTPFAVLGADGDGRIEINAYDTPRIQIIEQGATYNAQTEKARFGDLNGNWGYVSAIYGLALGEYASNKPNITIDGTNGLRIRSYSTDIMTFDVSGNAKITGKLQMPESNSAISIGSTPPTAANAGTGIWIDRTGYYGLDAGTYQVKIDAANGKLYAGGGAVTLDEDGLTMLCPEVNPAGSSTITWRDDADYAWSEITTWEYLGGAVFRINIDRTSGVAAAGLSINFLKNGSYNNGEFSFYQAASGNMGARMRKIDYLEIESGYLMVGGDGLVAPSPPLSNGDLFVMNDINYKSGLLGEWVDFSPTIGYAGGSTNPTSQTVNSARYCQVGKVVHAYVDLDITRGSGDRTITTVSYPISPANFYSVGHADQNITAIGHNIVPVYMAGNLAVYHGTMTRDGGITLFITYEIP